MQSHRATYDGKSLTFHEKVSIDAPKEVIVTFLEGPEPVAAEPVEEQFERLYAMWYAETAYLSDSRIFTNEYFLKIIGLGKPTVPFILRKLQQQHSFLFTALPTITGEDPVKKGHEGKPLMVVQDWLAWGREKKRLR